MANPSVLEGGYGDALLVEIALPGNHDLPFGPMPRDEAGDGRMKKRQVREGQIVRGSGWSANWFSRRSERSG